MVLQEIFRNSKVNHFKLKPLKNTKLNTIRINLLGKRGQISKHNHLQFNAID